MSDQYTSGVQAMQQEFSLLAEACTQLKTHPALTEMRSLSSLTRDHAGLMLHYATQLDAIFITIRRHAAALQKLSHVDMHAAQFSAIAERTVADLTRTISPIVDNLRRQAAILCNGDIRTPASARLN